MLQCSNAGNGNAHGFVRLQRKRVFGNNACACQQYRTVGKFLRTEKIFCKLTEPALNLIDRNLTIEYASAAAPNLEMNRPLPRSGFRCSHHNPWTNSAGALVDFCLWKIE